MFDSLCQKTQKQTPNDTQKPSHPDAQLGYTLLGQRYVINKPTINFEPPLLKELIVFYVDVRLIYQFLLINLDPM